MIAKVLFGSFESELTYLQKIEIEKGRKAGLTDEQVLSYAYAGYNFLQMREIRLALQNGIEMKKMKCMYRTSVSFKIMHWMRLKLERGEKVEDIALKKYMVVVFSFLVVMLSVSLFYPFCEEPYLDLKESSIILNVGETFHPMEHIDAYSRRKGQLILPEMIDTSVSGDHIAVYKLMSEDTVIEKVLYITVRKNTES